WVGAGVGVSWAYAMLRSARSAPIAVADIPSAEARAMSARRVSFPSRHAWVIDSGVLFDDIVLVSLEATAPRCTKAVRWISGDVPTSSPCWWCPSALLVVSAVRAGQATLRVATSGSPHSASLVTDRFCLVPNKDVVKWLLCIHSMSLSSACQGSTMSRLRVP